MLGHHTAGPYILQSGGSEILGTHQLPVGGFKLAQDPVTRQLYIIPGELKDEDCCVVDTNVCLLV